MFMRTHEYFAEALASFGKMSHSLWWKATSVLFAMVLSDWIWAHYIGSIAQQRGLASANWAALVILLGAYVVVSYVEDKRLIVPAAVGAWIGTYLGV